MFPRDVVYAHRNQFVGTGCEYPILAASMNSGEPMNAKTRSAFRDPRDRTTLLQF